MNQEINQKINPETSPKKKISHTLIAKISFLMVGMLLLLAALLLVLSNIQEDRNSGEEAQSILTAVKEQIPAYTEETQEKQYDLFAEYEEEPGKPEEPVIEIDNRFYIGVICIPELNIELPVLQTWDYPSLKIAPCRYQGCASDKNLIVIAHNYRSHFGRISELYSGSEIIFTDAAGMRYVYQVDNIEIIAGTDIERMEFGSAENWDITLFTCTLSGQSRVAVRASLITEDNANPE